MTREPPAMQRRAITVRSAVRADVALVVALIRELAEYEKLLQHCHADAARLEEHLFGAQPKCECLVGELDGVGQGFALFFPTYSTFAAAPGLWLEDLYVRPAARGSGLGRALLAELAGIAVERRCARLEWNVLDWNEPAIGFYRRLGARAMGEWTSWRIDGVELASLAQVSTNRD